MKQQSGQAPALIASAVTLLLFGAIGGFFYAYSSSVMRGLDSIDPAHAIVAMQGINATVRNAIFAPAFFGAPVAACLTAALLHRAGKSRAGILMLAAALIYVLGAFLPTLMVNVPMNEALATVRVPVNPAEAQTVWSDYSTRWTWWNHLRTIFSLVALLLVGAGIFRQARS